MENKLEMRELNGQDTFLLFPIISKLGITDLMKQYTEIRENVADKEADTEEEYIEIGIEVMGMVLEVVFENMDKAKDDINRLLANVCNTTQKEIKQLDFATYNLLIIELFKQEAFINFFKQLLS